MYSKGFNPHRGPRYAINAFGQTDDQRSAREAVEQRRLQHVRERASRQAEQQALAESQFVSDLHDLGYTRAEIKAAIDIVGFRKPAAIKHMDKEHKKAIAYFVKHANKAAKSEVKTLTQLERKINKMQLDMKIARNHRVEIPDWYQKFFNRLKEWRAEHNVQARAQARRAKEAADKAVFPQYSDKKLEEQEDAAIANMYENRRTVKRQAAEGRPAGAKAHHRRKDRRQVTFQLPPPPITIAEGYYKLCQCSAHDS